MVRNVCFIFNQKKRYTISLDKFNSYILLKDNVNVWFSVWRGIDPRRVPITDHKELFRNYEGEQKVLAMVKTSQWILRDSRKYVNNNLNTNFGEYTAVAFRTVGRKNALTVKGISRYNIMQYFYKCSEDVKHALISAHAKSLAIDLGRFGDLISNNFFKLNNDGTKLFSFVLKMFMAIKVLMSMRMN